MMGEIALLIDDKRFAGWKSAKVVRGLEALAAEFDLTLSDRFGDSTELRPLAPHVSCAVEIDGAPVLTGVIDQVTPSYDREAHQVTVTGRSLTGQLKDCAAIAPASELKGLSLAAIAARLAAPFDIEVEDLTGVERAFPRVAIEPGETCFETLQRLAEQRGVFLTDDARGRLVIRRRSTTLQGIVETGVNVLSCNGDLNGVDQFSNYIVKGQLEGADGFSPKSSARSTGRAVDASVPIHRPFVVLPSTQGDGLTMAERAEFEAAKRRGRARRWTYELAGWRRADGELWVAGEEVEVVDPFMGFDGERLLVVEAAFSIDDSGGEIVELEVAPPEGFDLVEEKAVVSGRSSAVGWDAE